MLTKSILKEFADIHGSNNVYIRGQKLARELGTRELRTKKNSWIAMTWDELGNPIAILENGFVCQFAPGEYEEF